MHLQTGLPAASRTPAGATEQTKARLESPEFGVNVDVQRALANIRTDLDAFCELEAWALMADGYQLTGRIVPARPGVAELGTPGPPATWPFDGVARALGPEAPDPEFLKVLRVGKERFLKPARMHRGGVAVANAVIAVVFVALAVGAWLLLTPHGTTLFIIGLATLAVLAIYALSDKAYVKPVAVILFDAVLPALFALPLVLVSWLQLAAGRSWLRLGRAQPPRAEYAPSAVEPTG
jgi:hypothetical protein